MNWLILVSNIVLGAILLFSYFYLGTQNKGVVEKLWGNIKGNIRTFYTVSIFVAAIGYLYMVYFLGFEVKNNNSIINKLLIHQIVIIVFSMLWMPLSIKYLSNKNTLLKILIILVLFIVGIAALANTITLRNLEVSKKLITKKNWAIAGSAYLFFQTFIMDFLSWNYNFF